MDARRVIFAAFLIAASTLATQAVPAPQPDSELAPEVKPQPAQSEKLSAPVAQGENPRAKRFFPVLSYASIPSAYSYLAPYANSYSAVHYPAPVVAAAHYPIYSPYSSYIL